MFDLKNIFSVTLVLMCFSGITQAADHVIKTRGVAYKPLVVIAQPGDRIIWEAAIGHNVASVEGLIPKGAKPWISEMGAAISVTLDKEGIYIYECPPHIGFGMGGAIVVGKPVNLEEVTKAAPKNPFKRFVKKAKKAYKKAQQSTSG